jgi:hypothetical protein
VGLEEPDREEERLVRLGPFGDQSGGSRGDVAHLRGVEVDDPVVAYVGRVGRDVLLADQPRPVPGGTQHIDDMALGVGEAVAPVGEAKHAGRMGALPGQQGGARPRAHGRGTERLAEHHPLVGQVLDVRRGHRIAVRLHVTARVVRVDIKDVGWRHT